MLATVTTYSELLRELQKVKDKALIKAGEKAEELVKKQIQSEVYDIPAGTYERTYNLKDSMMAFPLEKKGNVSEVKVAHDWMNMSYNVNKFQHGSNYWDPNDYRQYVAETVHYGLSGKLFGVGKHWHEPKPYMDISKDILEGGEYRRFIMDALRSEGFDVR